MSSELTNIDLKDIIKELNGQLNKGLQDVDAIDVAWIKEVRENLRKLLVPYRGPGRDELIDFGVKIGDIKTTQNYDIQILLARGFRFLSLIAMNLNSVDNKSYKNDYSNLQKKKTAPQKKKIEELELHDSVNLIYGFGERALQSLFAKRIFKVNDLLYYLPRNFEDRRRLTPIHKLEPGKTCFVRAQIIDWHLRKGGKSFLKVIATDNPLRPHFNKLSLIFFHFYGTPQSRFPIGGWINILGQVDLYKGELSMVHPQIELNSEEPVPQIVPVYPEIEGVFPKKFFTIMKQIVQKFGNILIDPIPEYILKKRHLPDINTSILNIHNPPLNIDDKNLFELTQQSTIYHQRLVYEELFYIQLALALRKRQEDEHYAAPFKDGKKVLSKIQDSLEYKLTGAQLRVVSEILNDLEKSHPMRRLLQGDVGCGKTIVAFIAACVAIENGFQVAFMAPTELLAEQHMRNLYPMLKKMGHRAALLIGSTRQSTKKRTKEQLEMGMINFIIGTHALIQEGIQFRKPGLVVVDEQHRFGVGQRLKLVQKGKNNDSTYPHLLVMTATPIPRSLALTVYGDLDLSVIDELPPGRKSPETFIYKDKDRQQVYNFVYDQLKKGAQAYVVCPLIEESEYFDIAAAKKVYEELFEVLKPFRVDLIHGKLPPVEKDEIMNRFISGESKIIVSTTVIEVGIDVPEATIMVIEGSERFGLAQLHQLRGRIGRGGGDSYCFLINKNYSQDSIKRLKILQKTTNGFKIAEHDLELRGPGELYGSRQSGVPGFKFARLSRDYEILSMARSDAFELIEQDPELKENIKLKEKLDNIWGWSGEKIVAEDAG